MNIRKTIDGLALQLAKEEMKINKFIFNDNRSDYPNELTEGEYVAGSLEHADLVVENIGDMFLKAFRKHYIKLVKERYPDVTDQDFS